VKVLSGAEIVTSLIGMIANLPQANGLLNNALKSLNNGNVSAACSQLSAFANQVQAQAGKKLTQAEAAQLLRTANAARAAIGCP
jgi:GH24 family phage-related lysozyme (muramidase)